MIDFSSKTYANLLADMLARIPSTYDKRDTSPIPTALGPAAWVIEGIYIALSQMQDQAFVGTATGEDLDAVAAIGGITRLSATPAVRLGVFNTPISLGARFSTVAGADSINFVATAATANPLEWWLTAETPGTIGNQYTGAILPISTIPGLTTAQITSIIVSGSDAETDDALRVRLTLALTDKPFAGNISAYREMLLELTEVGGVPVRIGGVQVYPTWDGGGTVKCSVVGSDYLPVSSSIVALIQEAVDPSGNAGEGVGLAPIGAEVTISTATTQTVNVSATVSHTGSTSIGSLQPLIEAAIEDYLAEVRSEWGIASTSDITVYSSSVYISRVTAAILGVPGVTNVTTVKLNNVAADLALTETSAVQQTPVLGTVTLTEG